MGWMKCRKETRPNVIEHRGVSPLGLRSNRIETWIFNDTCSLADEDILCFQNCNEKGGREIVAYPMGSATMFNDNQRLTHISDDLSPHQLSFSLVSAMRAPCSLAASNELKVKSDAEAERCAAQSRASSSLLLARCLWSEKYGSFRNQLETWLIAFHVSPPCAISRQMSTRDVET